MQSPVYFKTDFIRIDFYRDEKEPFFLQRTVPSYKRMLFVIRVDFAKTHGRASLPIDTKRTTKELFFPFVVCKKQMSFH